jgi:1,4-alpha-glucan branching enzyme
MSETSQVNSEQSAIAGHQLLERKLSSDKTRCLVTFWLPMAAAPEATSVAVAGSFNDWSLDQHPLKRSESGDFSGEIELESGREYEFRFVIDGVRWENAWNADKYVWSAYAQAENSVIVTGEAKNSR